MRDVSQELPERSSADGTWRRMYMRHRTMRASRSEQRGDAVGVRVSAPEVRVEHPRALEVEVNVDLPGEAHPTEDLGCRLAVHDRGFAREKLGAAHCAVESRKVGVEVCAARVYRRARDL